MVVELRGSDAVGAKRSASACAAPDAKRRKAEGRFRSLPLSRSYIQQICKGKKTVEGRIYERAVRNIFPGDVLHFHMYNPQRQSVSCEVLEKNIYASFQEMLESVGYKQCIPDAENLEEALLRYHQIPQYPQKEKKFGVVALHLQLKNPIEHEVLIQKKYFDLIKSGKKTVEGRINDVPYKKISLGDVILFKDETNQSLLRCRVLERHYYSSFREMLIEETLAKCLPDVGSVSEGERIYRSFPQYAEREKLCGAIAFLIQCLYKKIVI